MNVKKIVVILAVALGVFFVVTQPTQLAGLITSILDMLRQGAQALITFVQSLF